MIIRRPYAAEGRTERVAACAQLKSAWLWQHNTAEQTAFASSIAGWAAHMGFGEADVELGMTAAKDVLSHKGATWVDIAKWNGASLQELLRRADDTKVTIGQLRGQIAELASASESETREEGRCLDADPDLRGTVLAYVLADEEEDRALRTGSSDTRAFNADYGGTIRGRATRSRRTGAGSRRSDAG